jgi:hypothetical protein
LRVIVETDAGGDPDDEQSLVRVKHDRRFPTMEHLWQRTVAGYDGDAGVKSILAAADAASPPSGATTGYTLTSSARPPTRRLRRLPRSAHSASAARRRVQSAGAVRPGHPRRGTRNGACPECVR